MLSNQKNTITCPHCKQTYEREALKRNCSNCFSCTGCERYTCPQCDEEIIIQEARQAYSARPKQ